VARPAIPDQREPGRRVQSTLGIEIVPAFAFLELGRDLRWFRGKTAPDILRSITSRTMPSRAITP
jgi:uncharacterized protein involved in type VI secretion and phage assembly